MTNRPDTLYRAGSLVYNRVGLIKLFFWLLLGDFSMSIATTALPQLLPLQLDVLGIKPGEMGWLLSLGPLASLALSPFIGVWSDRLRTRWGRRRPFLLVSTPILALGLILIPHIKSYTLLCFIILIIQVTNVLETVLYYLYADIVPPTLMGRFMVGFRLMSTLGVLAFQHFMLPLFETSPSLAWTTCGIVYFALYQLSLHCVREGEYPDPKRESAKEIVKDYLNDGLGSRYVWLLWLSIGMTSIAAPLGFFTNLFCKQNLNLSMSKIGDMNAMATIPAFILLLPSGWLLDRFGPRWLWGSCCVGLGLSNFYAFFFVHNALTMTIYFLVSNSFGTVTGVALIPMLYAHLPKMRFGQLVSVQSVIVQSLFFISTNVLGDIIYIFNNNCRLAFLYCAPFYLFPPLFLFLLTRVPNPFFGQEMAMARNQGAGQRLRTSV